MTPISIMIRRMARLPRHHRIAHLKALIQELPARSIRRQELTHLLRDEMTKQLRKENAA
jgi:hypothetical protein